MDHKITSIAKLSRYNNFCAHNLTIEASVMIKSIRHDNSEHMYFYFDLRDDSGEISAVAYNDACKKFFKEIKENKTYMITGFGLETSDKYYTSIEHPKQLVLRVDSLIQFCGKAPPIDWRISSLDGEEEDAKFFNVLGMCIDMTYTDTLPDKLVRRVKLVDEEGNQVTLAVWNAETFIFDALDLDLHPVFLVIDARNYNYGGREILTTSRYLQLLDPSDPRACRVKNAQASHF